MTNRVYPKFMEAMLDSASDADINDNTVKVALVDTGAYTYNAAHDFYDDVSAAVIGTPQTIANTTVTNGVFDGDNVTFPAVPGTTSVEALVIFIDTGTPTTSRLVAYIDTGVTNLPVTTNGGNIDLAWNASGIIDFVDP